MARPKTKTSVPISMRVDANVLERLNAYCEEVGQPRTTAIERIVTGFLDQREKQQQLANTSSELHYDTM